MTSRSLQYIRRHHVGLLALLIALGGTSYAAARLPAGSVGTTQLKRGAVTNSKVRPHSLRAGVFAKGQLLRGPAGKNGATNLFLRQVPTAVAPPSPDSVGVALCMSGERAVAGGFDLFGSSETGTPTISKPVAGSDQKTPNGWMVAIRNGAGIVYVVCASP